MGSGQRRVLWYIAAAAAALAVLWKPLSQSGLSLDHSRLGALLIFTQTGRLITAFAPQQEDPAPIQPQVQNQSPEQTLFAPADAQLVQINNLCAYPADIPALLQKPLSWDLTQQGPAVLILHTHTCESYTKTADYKEDTAYRTRDENYNMLRVGDQVAQALEQAGIGVIHDRTFHDYPSYDGSYIHSRESVRQYLQQYPSIRLILDLHRDAMTDSKGKQLGTTVSVGGQQAAQLMIVTGTNAGGMDHAYWQENLAFAVKLQAQTEKLYPGICRPLRLSSQRFNQDLSPGAVLVEVGAAGNTLDQALLAADCLSQAIIALSKGCK